MKLSTIIIALATLIATFSVQAEDRHDKRQDRQAKRIRHGLKNGELTNKEIKTLFKQQKKIKRMEKRFESDGELTRKEKKRLEKAQDRASKKIFKKKHNKRDRNQNEDRIKQARKKKKRIMQARKKMKRIENAKKKKKRIALARRKAQARKNNATDLSE